MVNGERRHAESPGGNDHPQRGRIITAPRVPPRAVEAWKRNLMYVVREAINKHDTQRREAAFGLLLLLPALILSHSTKGAKSLDQDVKRRRCRLFMNGQLSPLIRERGELAAAHVARCAAGQRRGETESAVQARKRAAKIARRVNLGQFSKARCHLLSPGMAEVSPQVLQQLREKHAPRVV